MASFKDLKFSRHSYYPHFEKIAKLQLPNKFGISVVNGKMAQCDENTYEVMITFNDAPCYTTPFGMDVLSYQTEEDINNVLKELSTYSEDILNY